ncbi:hypothetical protein [Bacillus sp. ISL-39]|uniref:hypothetical protein n=1 Tax=Bacillus sp. ISL-39 TaxID=2819124 RepID=UPI001BE74606|nr:hypothetical protein [Bacillus sp. ISL-39]MBT2636576.1 hypothetical protein [Bacillus sp. ISL-39]
MSLKRSKSDLYEVWERYGCPDSIVHPEQILQFLEEIIIVTNGNLNTDYYAGGYSDNIYSVKKEGGYFYLYWKNFEKYVRHGRSLTESEAEEIAIFGNHIYIYQALNIKSLIFKEYNYDVYIIINCRYFSKRELIKELTNKYRIGKNDIVEIDTPHYVEFIFTDLNYYTHSCQLIPFPINALLIQEKKNPLDDSITRKIMHLAAVEEFEEILLNWCEEIEDLVDYQDERKIKNMGNDIRTETERLLKYYILSNTVFGDENFEKLQSTYNDLLNSYGHVTLGELSKKSTNIELDIPKEFVLTLNTLSHDSGKATYKKDIQFALENFKTIISHHLQIS